MKSIPEAVKTPLPVHDDSKSVPSSEPVTSKSTDLSAGYSEFILCPV